MKKRKISISDIIFIIFIALLIIPQTRQPIQVAVNKLKVAVWSPGLFDTENQEQIRPFQYTVRDMTGASKTIPIGQGKVTFLSYWATWCAPCIAELPEIQKLYMDYGDKVNFILLTQEDTHVVQEFLIKKGYDVPAYNPTTKAPEKLQENSIPTTYIIDTQGKIVIRETGAADWNSKKVRDKLDVLLTPKRREE
ncbi:hypothetical protein LCGC14_1239230 [marine sediment metagenome]|uniref:TlpA family protein disulfide reductase n=2 Tax=root TaxID=1 RepID=A0A831VW58_9FLAO|nr:TlpA family protein disulfide reductase [Pricia sp.]HEA22054.1 TlpA family protein disulfide reductase [Pricia antarctica]